MSNSEKHPEAWKFFKNQARNISKEKDLKHLGRYRIPNPDRSGNFIYANEVDILWFEFIKCWYEPALDSPSVYGQIQYIVQTF